MEQTKSITIGARIVHHAVAGAQHAGLDIARLIAKCGIDPAAWEAPDGRIPLEKVVMLQRYCQGILRDEMSGLLERPLRLGFFRLMGLAVVHTRTLGEALERALAFYNLFDNSFWCRLDRGAAQTVLELERIPDHRVLDCYAIDYLLPVFHRFIGWLGNRRLLLNQVELDFPPPDYLDEYRYIYYGAPVLFGQDINRLIFDSSYLEQPVVQNEATVESLVRRAPLDLYLPLDAGGPFTEKIRVMMQTAFDSNSMVPALEQLAAELGMNPQTLRRRLKTEGTSFHTIKAQVRRDIAIHLLGGGQHSIEAIAEQAGYSEPSAFIRAFKSWTGFTPLQFRKGLEF